tara:strand:+ start:51 stop:704 length:654 start_codon:yes stop_codon:yes gene_type:complete
MPIDAGIENSGFMMGQQAQAFEGQNHQAHIDAHRSLFLTEVVKTTPQLQGLIIAHMMQHLQFLAVELSADQMPPEAAQQIEQANQMMQSGQIPQEQASQVQADIQMMQEQFSSPILAQLTQELMVSIGQGNETDPLVQIRQQELALRDKEIDQDSQQFSEKQAAKQNETLLETEISKQRMGVQKQVADDKLDLGLKRLEQQNNLKLMEMGAKFGSKQ